MRLWSIHPKYLDSKGLVALWREALLAQAVLLGKTKGYKKHPQLQRFTVGSIGAYLYHVWEEGVCRGYNFDAKKIEYSHAFTYKIAVTSGQMDFEMEHLHRKLADRNPEHLWLIYRMGTELDAHPIFVTIEGPVEPWEKLKEGDKL